jgi:nucleotide-binding universal stress UspA family protein
MSVFLHRKEMIMFNKILVPLDGSELAERALKPALTVAHQAKGQVILLSVSTPKHMVAAERAGYGLLLPNDSFEKSQQELAAYLETIRGNTVEAGFNVCTRVLDGDPASVIVDVAAEEDVDLIAMSTRGLSGLTRWVLGSVTEKVLRAAPCPVLVTRSSNGISKVLITLDGSELAEQALKPGFEFAQCIGAEVFLLQVLNIMSPGEMRWLNDLEAGLAFRLQEDSTAYLKTIAGDYRDAGGGKKVQTIVSYGHAATSILDTIENLDIDLIVLATHGRTGLRRWVYGSVTEKILHSANCAMLVVRPAAHQLN